MVLEVVKVDEVEDFLADILSEVFIRLLGDASQRLVQVGDYGVGAAIERSLPESFRQVCFSRDIEPIRSGRAQETQKFDGCDSEV